MASRQVDEKNQRSLHMNENPNAYVCIMAGGSGERFWPMSRQRTPKHLLKLFGDRTLLEDTVRRFEGVVPAANIFVLTNEAQVAATPQALPFLAPSQIVAEPAKRDTAPAAALATGLVRARNPAAVMALLPADALIKNHERLAQQMAAALARSGVDSEPGVDTEAVQATGLVQLLGGGQPVGEIRAAF